MFLALVPEVVLSFVNHGPLVRPDDLLRGDAAAAQAVEAAQGKDERGHQEAKKETTGQFLRYALIFKYVHAFSH